MKIKSVTLKNGYKRFHNTTIDLGAKPPRIVALVGPNGCGKSSVLDGILFLQNQHQQLGSTGGKDVWYHYSTGVAQAGSQDVVVMTDQGNFPTVFQSRQQSGQQGTMVSFRSPYRYNAVLKIKQTKATREISHNDYGASSTDAIDGKMEENYRRLHAKYNKFRDDNDLKPSEAKAKIIGDLNASLKACLDLEIENLGNVEANQGTLYFKKSVQQKPFDFNILSSGEKEVVDILLDLYLRKDDYTETVFLIDEPELHISTAVQKKLLIEIEKLIGKNCQLWVATHSIGFLRALQEELKNDCEIIYFKPTLQLATQEETLRPVEKSIEMWRQIFATAIDDLAGLLSPRRLVYCEGEAKPSAGRDRGLDSAVYNSIFNGKYHDTLFISSGGNTELDQRSEIALAILSKVFAGIEILVLKDRDFASGHQTNGFDRDEYLKLNGANHRVLLRWEIENYLYDKEVLRAYCEAKSETLDEAIYDKLVPDIVNDDVKGMTGKMKNLCHVKGSISPDMFKKQLAKMIRPEMEVYSELERCIFGPQPHA